MKFNEKLITLRKEKGLSQENLGEKLDVTRQTISKWELGETTPEMDKLILLSEVFDISLDELIKEKDIKSVDEVNSVNNTNTQKLAGIVIFILKAMGILFIISFIFIIIGLVVFSQSRTNKVETIYSNEQILYEKNVNSVE